MPKEDPFVNRAQLLKAIKKYPEIWDSNNKLHMCRSVTAPMWNEIAEQFGGHVPTVKLQSIWSQMKYHYHNLVHRQILHKERFTTKWEHFEPMSFMYNITVSKIVGAAATAGAGSNSSTVVRSDSPVLALPPPGSIILPLPSPSPSVPHNRGRPSGSFTSPWLLPHSTSTELNILDTPESPLPPPPYTAFTGLVPPAAITVETTTTVTPTRKPGRPGSMNNSMRGRIIDVIREHPTLWAGRQPPPPPPTPGSPRDGRQSQNRTSAVWKLVAAALGLTPSLVQTRWSIIKQRYVDELQKERHAQYAQSSFHSNWEHFDRMCFMRDILSKKVDEREQTREQIQEIVSEQQQQQQQQQHLRYMRVASTSTLATPTPQHAHPLEASASSGGAELATAAVAAAGGVMLPSAAAMLHAGPAGGHTLYHPQAHHPHLGLPPVTSPAVPPPLPPHAHHHHHLQYHAAAHHPHHPHAAFAAPSLSTAASGRTPGAGMVCGARRVKTENDLEWDPFEMILHVQGPEVIHN